MDALRLDGVSVSVLYNNPKRVMDGQTVKDTSPAGGTRINYRFNKQTWEFRTTPITKADATVLVAIIENVGSGATPFVLADGFLIGAATRVRGEVTAEDPLPFWAGGVFEPGGVQLTFKLYEV